jgi:hypothetical protein
MKALQVKLFRTILNDKFRILVFAIVILPIQSCNEEDDNNATPNQAPPSTDVYFKIKLGSDPAKTYTLHEMAGSPIESAYVSYSNNLSRIRCILNLPNSIEGAELNIRIPGSLSLGSYNIATTNSTAWYFNYFPYTGQTSYSGIPTSGVTVDITRIDSGVGGIIEGTFSGSIGFETDGGLNGNPVLNSWPSTGEFRVIRNY